MKTKILALILALTLTPGCAQLRQIVTRTPEICDVFTTVTAAMRSFAIIAPNVLNGDALRAWETALTYYEAAAPLAELVCADPDATDDERRAAVREASNRAERALAVYGAGVRSGTRAAGSNDPGDWAGWLGRAHDLSERAQR